MWQAHSLFQEIELRKLGEIQLDVRMSTLCVLRRIISLD